MTDLNVERDRRAKERAIMMLTVSLDETLQLEDLLIAEIAEILAGPDAFAEIATLIGTLVSWVAGSIEGDAEAADKPVLLMLSEFADYLREEDA